MLHQRLPWKKTQQGKHWLPVLQRFESDMVQLLTYMHFPLKLTSNWLLNELKIVNVSRSSSRLGCREWLGSDLWVVLDLDSRINNSSDLSSSTNRVSNEAIESIFEPSSPILFYILRTTSLKYTCIFCLFTIVTRLLGFVVIHYAASILDGTLELPTNSVWQVYPFHG